MGSPGSEASTLQLGGGPWAEMCRLDIRAPRARRDLTLRTHLPSGPSTPGPVSPGKSRRGMALWVVGTASAPPPAPGHGEQDLAASQPVGHRAPWRGGAASPQLPGRGLLQLVSPASWRGTRVLLGRRVGWCLFCPLTLHCPVWSGGRWVRQAFCKLWRKPHVISLQLVDFCSRSSPRIIFGVG